MVDLAFHWKWSPDATDFCVIQSGTEFSHLFILDNRRNPASGTSAQHPRLNQCATPPF